MSGRVISHIGNFCIEKPVVARPLLTTPTAESGLQGLITGVVDCLKQGDCLPPDFDPKTLVAMFLQPDWNERPAQDVSDALCERLDPQGMKELEEGWSRKMLCLDRCVAILRNGTQDERHDRELDRATLMDAVDGLEYMANGLKIILLLSLPSKQRYPAFLKLLNTYAWDEQLLSAETAKMIAVLVDRMMPRLSLKERDRAFLDIHSLMTKWGMEQQQPVLFALTKQIRNLSDTEKTRLSAVLLIFDTAGRWEIEMKQPLFLLLAEQVRDLKLSQEDHEHALGQFELEMQNWTQAQSESVRSILPDNVMK